MNKVGTRMETMETMDGCRGCTSNKGDNQYRFKILLCLLSLNGPLTAMSNSMLDLIKVVILTPV